jgi:hypothetical protein
MRISQRYSLYNNEVNSFVSYMSKPGNATRLKVSAEQLSEIQNLLADWQPKFAAYMNPDTHNDISVAAINNAYKKVHPVLQSLKKQLKSNKSISLIALDYGELYIHQNKPRRAHIPRPFNCPTNEVLLQHHLVVKIFSRNPDDLRNNRRKLPDDVAKIGRKLAIVNSDVWQPAPELYQYLDTIGYSRYVLKFDPEDVGKCGWLITWYINPRGEAGPPSEPCHFYII